MIIARTLWARWRSRVLIGAIGVTSCFIGSCSATGSSGTVEIDDGSLRGELIETEARYDDGTGATSYQLRMRADPNDVRELEFRLVPSPVPMGQVKVWGTAQSGKILVDRLERAEDEEIGSIEQPLVGQAPLAPLKLAMALVDIGTGNANAMITPAELQARVFTNAQSTKAYYLENSYGMQSMTGKVVDNVLSYPMTTCDTSGMAKALKPMIDANVGQTSDVYLWYFQGKASACSWSGLSSGANTYYNASSGCVVLAQEPAHSLGLAHSSSMTCGTNAFLDDPNMGCTHNEYGSPYDTMGGGCRHFSAYHKTYRTYTQKCNVVRVRQSGTWNLFPTEKACNGIQVLQVPMAHVRPFTNTGGGSGGPRNTQLAYYTVELRSPIGFDVGMKPSVLIYASPAFSFNTAAGRANSRGEHVWLLDMTPGNNTARDGSSHALAAGQTFTDPAGGISITTVAVSADVAQIKVDITGPVSVDGGTGDTICVDNTPISAPGPAECGDDGGVVVIPPPPPPPPVDAGRDARADGSVPAGTGGAGGTRGSGGAGGAGTAGGAGGIAAGGASTSGGGAGDGSNGASGSGVSSSTTNAGSGTTAGSGGSSSGAATGNAGSSTARAGASDAEGGCACRVTAPQNVGTRGRGLAAIGLALAGFARRRRRRTV